MFGARHQFDYCRCIIAFPPHTQCGPISQWIHYCVNCFLQYPQNKDISGHPILTTRTLDYVVLSFLRRAGTVVKLNWRVSGISPTAVSERLMEAWSRWLGDSEAPASSGWVLPTTIVSRSGLLANMPGGSVCWDEVRWPLIAEKNCRKSAE